MQEDHTACYQGFVGALLKMDTYGSRKAMPYSMLGNDETVQERYMHMTNKLRYLTQPTLICVPGALIEQRSLRQVVRPVMGCTRQPFRSVQLIHIPYSSLKFLI